MATLEDLKDYLGAGVAAMYSDDLLQDILDSETSAQAARCRPSTSVIESLEQALLRRCQRALAMKALPLGMTDAGGEGQSSYVPRIDGEIRRLEGPYRRMPF